MQTQWKKRNLKQDNEKALKLQQELAVDPVLAQVLVNRGFEETEQARNFLWPSLMDLHNPNLIPDMDKAVKRIIKAIQNNERITVYADYDADGTVAAAILILYLRDLGAEVDYYIPNRLTEGYGMNNEALDEIAQRGTNLIITVDNGIASVKQAEHAYELGMELIVTDHHESQESLPKAEAILDCKRLDSDYPFKELCGAAIAFKLVSALEEKLESGADLMEYLQMATVSTVADIVPLEDENRIIVKNGIKSINEEGFIHEGLYELSRISDIDELNTYLIGFRIGPMINAPGRLGEADEVMTLLLADDPDVIQEQAKILYDKNVERTQLEKDILKEALKKVEGQNLQEEDIIIVDGKGWHSGVIGIVASKIQERWNKPVIIISFDENGLGRGSCRSIPGFNIFKALQSCATLFENFGGHEQAAGLSIKEENLNKLKQSLKEYTSKLNMKELFVKKLKYDIEAKPEDFTIETVKALKDFEPTGIGNPAPIFLIKAGTANNFRFMGADKSHLGFFADGVNCIGFGLGEEYPQGLHSPLRFLAKAELNCYNNSEKLQFNIKDIRENPFVSLKAAEKILKECTSTEDLLNALEDYNKPTRIDRKLLVYVYNLIKSRNSSGFLINHFLQNSGESVFALAAALVILKEAELIDYEYNSTEVKGRLLPVTDKKDLTKTPTYQLLETVSRELEK